MQPRRQRKKRAAARPPRPWLPVAIVGTAALLAVVLIIVFSNTGGSSDGKPAKTTPGPTASAVQSGTSLGQDDAPVTMIEYFSFQCSHCADYARDTAPQIEKDFVETGKLRIEFHALGGEGKLLQASEAAACAGEQNRYLEYYKYLFANRDRGFDKGTLREYARDLGLDTEAFNSCLDSGGGSQQIISDTNDAMEQNLGTPTFFFGQTGTIDKESLPYRGETSIVGAESYDVFKKAIEDELAKAQ
jgi:protein-disulfide isomerase